MQMISKDELIGLFESLTDNDEKISGLQEQIKMIKQDSKEKIKTFAETIEAKFDAVNDTYKYYKKVVTNGENDEDFFTLCASVDLALTEEDKE